ncbi:MAG: CusA/CzcA family heavy metal efflux RND transporter [Methylotenera sp. 24-45-7]|jgi:cobalt-zinc-cadmium resistance protein CzcA|nr:MAG: CusA/CzcA family heavy metal efflux RND transporter [Mehylophilales bacterium 35-46-6]OYZ40337.1 MAG: CusA/CzcA family heavy metal efflux RND transporter [Methylotenera sp. 24-45-7]OZA09188.1 MAG: CusA/CzcA family heavy metal efflux RND transporter [Methylotenera sp. 17-45-7]OZA53234.1 MAG: CusA/CzcA family heavy metal efflux RND transporter [Methylophilales bacterium 39-45-7]HQS37731.1 CusA/CzcA family heavy metal efflux RND transporter [Methylotenera sp.]
MIESLVRAALKQRLVLLVIAVALMVAGTFALKKLSVDAFPDVTNVQVQIATQATGKSPEEVERFITVPLEISMTGLPGLTEMRSLNRNGLSLITLVFTDSTNVYFARQLVMERLMEVADKMPQGVTPVLGPVATGLGEVYQYTLDHPSDGNKELSVEELKERRAIQDWVVRPLLRGIPGVAEINSQGGYVKQYQALVNPDRMNHYGLKLQDIYMALAKNNANSGGGVLPQFAEQYLIRGVGLIENLDDIRNIVLKEQNGVPVFMRDVAEVHVGHEVRVGAVLKNGYTESVGGIVIMIRAGNAKEVVSRVKERVKEINDKGMLPNGLQIVPYYDRSELVDAALFTVTKVLIEGIILVIIILFLFLGDVRSSIIVVATLVLTPLITFMAMNHYGISANLMSLGGLAIAIGLMVDGSVVVVENAFHHLGHRQGESKVRVVLEAATEVGTPVLFGVGIIILVFLPLMTLEGMEGKMFAPLAMTIAIALFVSLVISLTLSPVLCSYILKGGSGEDTKFIQTIKKPYLAMLNWALVNDKKTITAATATFVVSLLVVPLLGTSFIPEMKEGSIVPGINRVPNISLEESIKMENEAMRLIMEQVPGVKSAMSGIGRGESPADPQAQNESTPIISLKPREEWPEGWTQDDIADKMTDVLSKGLPGVQIVMAQPISDRVDELLTGVRSDVAVKIFGDDMVKLKNKADEVAKIAGTVQGAVDIRVEKVSGQQYLNITINRQAIARQGINASDIHDIIETAIGGKVATEIYEGQRRFSAAVRFPEGFRNDTDAIGNILVTSPNGSRVALRDLAKIEIKDGPAQISRELGKRRIVVAINVRDRDLGGFVAELQKVLDVKLKLTDGYYLEYGGQFQNLERALNHLMIIVPITIAAIFFLLFLLFNSVRYATMIIMILPFASIGGIFALLFTGEYLSVPASVGFIALWGIAVLNGVVLVSYIRSLRDDGRSQMDAIVEGCKQRFRPVMMTATVAMLALVPFLFATGPGSEIQRPLAIVVIGGLISSTLLTLVVVPTLYRRFEEKRIEA